MDQQPALRDFYNAFDPLAVTDQDKEDYQKFLSTLTADEKALVNNGLNFYIVDLSNVGGLVMPVILKIDYADGSTQDLRIPAEVWRYNSYKVSKLVTTSKQVAQITLDPHLETADVDLSNNSFPRRPVMTRFQLFKSQQPPANPMQLQERKGRPTASGGGAQP